MRLEKLGRSNSNILQLAFGRRTNVAGVLDPCSFQEASLIVEYVGSVLHGEIASRICIAREHEES